MGWASMVILALALALAAPLDAFAQVPQPSAKPSTICGDARDLKLDGEAPFAGATISYARTRDCANIVLYRLTPKNAPRTLTIEQRRARVQDERPETAAPRFYARVQRVPGYPDEPSPPPMWADQKTCPALLPAIKGLERAMSPKFTGDGPVRSSWTSITMDGAGVEVWASGQLYPGDNIGNKFQMTFDTNVGTPTADWVEKTLKDLAPCLSPGEPTVDAPIP